MTNRECWVLSENKCCNCPYRGGRPGCIRLTPDRISDDGIERLLNGVQAQAIKDFMKGFKYTQCRKEPKAPIPPKEPAEDASAKEIWKYRQSMARFKRRFESYKRWHTSKRNMINAENYFRSEEFAALTDYQYKPNEIIARMKRSVRHMSYKNIEEGTGI